MNPTPLTPTDLEKINAYWRAANYLWVGQIYLYDNSLLTGPLKLEHVQPRLNVKSAAVASSNLFEVQEPTE
jgi:phosphoketolase